MNLIYTIAYPNALGDEAWHQTFKMVESLRTFGKFDGDIIVFAPHAAEIPGAKVVCDITPLSFYNPKLGKPYFGMTHDFSRYEQVMFLDSDIVAINPVAPLFVGTGIRAPIDYDPDGTIGLHCLPELPIKKGDKGFNTGTIVAEAALWPIFCRQWWTKLLEVHSTRVDKEFRWVDQPVFNHLHWAGFFHATYLPLESVFLFHQDQKITNETVFVHCTQLTARGVMNAIMQLRSL